MGRTNILTDNKYVNRFIEAMTRRGFNVSSSRDLNNIEYRQGTTLMKTKQGFIEAQFRLCYKHPDNVQAALYARNMPSGYEYIVQEVRNQSDLSAIVKLIDDNKVE